MPAPLRFSQFRAALFDIDGTLMDSTQQCIRGLSDTYHEFGGFRPSDVEIASTIGIPLTVQLTMFGLGPAEPEELEERIAFAIGRYEAYEELVKEHSPAIEALEWASKQGVRIALVTSKNAREVERFRTYFRAMACVDAVVSASDVSRPKPDAESAELACRRLGVESKDAVFIGDSIFDIRCARSAGVSAIAVAYGASDRTTLAAESPDLLFETPEELRDWVADAELMTYAKKERTPIRST